MLALSPTCTPISRTSFRRLQLFVLLVVLWQPGSLALHAGERIANWSGKYPPCYGSREMANNGHINVGVRFYTSSPEVKAAIAGAMHFWTTVIDMDWHEENSTRCTMQIVDGRSRLFKPAQAARSQLPGYANFQGWIAFNPKLVLSRDEWYTIAVHEVGHLLGLPHNPSVHSVMYYLSLDGLLLLDTADLTAASAHHTLIVPVDQPRCVLPPASSQAPPVAGSNRD